jgi:general secretion pathway protein H
MKRIPMPRGFTLVEMLVVLMIMGLLLGLVSISAAPDDKARLGMEVERLAQLMDMAVNESRLTGRPIAWTSDGLSYRFWRLSEAAGWLPIDGELLRVRNLPPGMRLSRLQVANQAVARSLRVEFNSRGDMPLFRVEMSLGDASATVASSPLGDIRVLPITDAGGVASGLLARP